MNRAVLDASIIVRLFFEEDHSDAAEQCVRTIPQLSAPDLIWVEATNVIRKRCRRGDLAPTDAAEIAARLVELPLRIHESAGLIADALKLAIQFDRTVYDGLYVALAVKTQSVMITGDQRLVNGLAGTPFGETVAWIGDETWMR